MTVRCYLGLGSNLDEPAAQLQQALASLREHPAISLHQCSRFYASKAIGPGAQDNYVNAVACIDTQLPAEQLLTELHIIEQRQGRKRALRWGPRTLDIDILLYGEHTIATPRLQIPHPRLAERAFVLLPLAEIAPELHLPNGTSLPSLLDYVGTDDVWLLQSQDGV